MSVRRRRLVLALAAGTLGTGAMRARAQPRADLPRVVFISNLTAADSTANLEAFRAGLRDLGHVEGRTVVVEARYTDGDPARLPALAAGVVATAPAVIVAAGPQAARALKAATRAVPVVLAVMADPVGAGIVPSLARPGANITGLAFQNVELTTKRLQLLREVAPSLRQVAVLADATMGAGAGLEEAGKAADALALIARMHVVRTPDDIAPAFDAMRREGAQGVAVLASPMLAASRKPLVQLAAQNRLPATYEVRSFVDEGGLMSHGPSFLKMFRQSASYVDRILKGARPADLPFEQSSAFELVLNVGAARALRLTIPRLVLLRADDVVN